MIKTVLILLLIGFILLIIFMIFNNYQKSIDSTIIIDNKNKYNKNLDPQVFKDISYSAYSTTKLNFDKVEKYYHGTIRDDTFEYTKYGISFILDIPKLEISWSIKVGIDNQKRPISDVFVGCVDSSQMIYKTSKECIDKSSGGFNSEQLKLLKITNFLPLSGFSYRINTKQSNNNIGLKLIITYYSTTGKNDALNAIIYKGFDPANYEIEYIDKSKL